jgi:branched-chain amino acid transport system substrate-binding protein
MWLFADIIWAFYQLVLDIVPPIPSAADYLWLGAYGFLGYYLFMTYKEFQSKFNFGRKALVASIIGNAIFLCYIIVLTANLSVLSSPRGIQMFVVIVAYPILDVTLMVPAIVILVEFRKEPLWFTPWICETLGIFLIAISDSWFALIVLTSLVEQLWLSALFFAAHFLVMAAGLLWYIKLLIPHTTESRHQKEVGTRVEPPTLIEKGTDKRKGIAPTIGIAVAALTAIVLIGILVFPSSPLKTLFVNTNSEVIIPPNDGKQTTTLGALLPLSGALSSLGESEAAALKVAIKDVNGYFSKINSNTRVGLIIEDTQTNPAISLERLKNLAAKGIRIVIGPATSADVQEVEDYANKNGILIISPSSTARSLSGGYNVFRFVLDNTHQAQALSKHIWQDGIRVVVPIWRTDVYGNDIVGAVREDFGKLGGIVLDGIGYAPRTGDFSTSLNRINFIIWDQDLRSLSSKVTQAADRFGADKVGVYLVAFDEVVPIFIEAQNQPVLSMVKWYGSGTSALNNRLVRNIEAAMFAAKTDFINPIFGVDNNSYKFKLVDNQIQEMIGRVPRSYAEVAYDAFWVAALTENATAGTKDINSLRKTLLQITNSYTGITGNTSLDEAGYRKYGDYDFWAVKANDGTNNDHSVFQWKKVGVFKSDTNTTYDLTPPISKKLHS